MNKDIADFYLAQINKGQINKDLVHEALFAGIRTSNALLVRKSLNLLPPLLDWKEKDRFHIADLAKNELASKEVIELLVEKGIAFDGPP